MGTPRSGWVAIGAAGAALAIPAATATSPVSRAAVGVAAAAVGLVIVGVITVAASGRLAAAPSPRLTRASLAATAGAVLVALRIASAGPPTPPPSLSDAPGPWRAVIEAVGAPRDGSQVATLRLSDTDPPVRLAATLPRYPAVAPGTIVVVDGAAPRPPSEDGYGAYLRRTGVHGTLRARALEVIDDGPPLSVDRARRAAGQALIAALPEPEAGLAAGILVGLREFVDRDLAADFTTAGASHVVAISGWNIALVAGIVAAAAGRLGRRRRSVLIALAVVAYTIAAGASPSVVRAAAMASVALLARETGRPGRAASALGGAAALLLVVDPGLVMDAGFQLSVVATAGLLAWATPTTAAIDRLARGRLPRWIVEGLGISLAAQAVTLPIVLGSFGRLSLVAPAVNLVVVPLVPLAMAAGTVALVGGAVVVVAGAPAMLATLAGLPAWLVLTVIVRVVRVGRVVLNAEMYARERP